MTHAGRDTRPTAGNAVHVERSWPADESLTVVRQQLADSTRLFGRALAGVSQDALFVRPGPRSNPLLWIAGHLVQQRTRLLGAVGPPRQLPWDELFGTGSVVGDPSRYPSAGELDAVWRSSTEELMRRLDALPPDSLARPSPDWLVSRDGTLLGALTYAAYHEAYHIGQLSFVRKWLGFDPLMDEGKGGTE